MDDDSLSRRAADFTAQWTEASLERRHRDAINGTGAGSWGPSGVGGGISNPGVLALAAVLGGAAGSLGGAEHWIASAAIGAGLFVGLIVAAKVTFSLLGWTWALGTRGTEATARVVGGALGGVTGSTLGGVLSGPVGAVLRGGLLGAASGAGIAAMAGGDIPVMEGVMKFAPAGAVLGLVIHLVRRARGRR